MKEITLNRVSNFELCRILAMFLVMAVHANFTSIGEPTVDDMHSGFIGGLSRYFFESISIICVDVFVLLSGWFGIKVSMKKLMSFLFQVLFFYIIIFFVGIFFLGKSMTIAEIAKYFTLATPAGWFIKAYIALFIISPVLELFILHATKEQYRFVLIGFFLFQTVYDWLLHESVSWLSSGASLPTMAFLYLLARYIKNAPPQFLEVHKKTDILCCLLISIVTALLSAIARYKLNISLHLYLYSCPFVVLSSLFFMHFFSQLSFNSSAVNWVARSAFAVYLLHGNPLIVDEYFYNRILGWFNNETLVLFFAKLMIYLIMIYIVAVLIDQIRLYIWQLLIQKRIQVKL